MRRILRQTLPLQRRMNQVHRAQRILLDDQPALHGLVEDPNEELTNHTRVIMQVRGTPARHLTAQARAAGMTGLGASARARVLSGDTTLDEVGRVLEGTL